MIDTVETDEKTQARARIDAGTAHTQVYHIRCSRCGATTVYDVDFDTVRIICPSCQRRLTLPATVDMECSGCATVNEFPHTLAGHSAMCQSCARLMTIGPVVGIAAARRRNHRRHSRSRPRGRTFAFSEGAERSMILIAAAVATLIFVLAASMW